MKKVTVEYWVDGVRRTKIVRIEQVETTKKFLRWAGASGVKVWRGKTKKKEK